MVFFFVEEPALPFGFLQSAFNQPQRNQRPMQWLNQLINHQENSENSEVCKNCNSSKTDSQKTQMEPVKVTKKTSQNMSIKEDMAQLQIKIELEGYNIKPETLDVQVINDEIIQVKSDSEDLKFDRKFKIPLRSEVEKIDCKIDSKEEGKHSIIITIPKANKIKQIPIAVME